MSWAELHQQSERAAAEAESLSHASPGRARELYAEAAKLEALALADLAPTKLRTMGITAVSTVALWFKAREFGEAQRLAHRVMANYDLPPFAAQQLQELLQTIWSEEVRQGAGLKFSEGAVIVSVSGGQSVVTGGAPLDLVLSKVENIKALFFRTVEYLQHLPHRKHGGAPLEVRNVCRPWLFQAAPGSYQFAVAIEDVAQRNLFGPEIPSIDEIKDTFLSFIRASAVEPCGTVTVEGTLAAVLLELEREMAAPPLPAAAVRLIRRLTGDRHSRTLSLTTGLLESPLESSSIWSLAEVLATALARFHR
jgi:hypothetical protein